MYDNASYILAIADSGSISKAAKRMHISQPALSQRLMHLEKELGARLFDRTSTPVKPTHAGEIYLSWAREVVESRRAMIEMVSDVASGAVERLTIGVSVPRSGRVLSDIIAEFRQLHPTCLVVLRAAGMPTSHDELLSTSEINFSIFTPVAPRTPSIEGWPVCREEMLLLVPSSWNLGDITKQDASSRNTDRAENQPCGERSVQIPTMDLSCLNSRPLIMPPDNLRHARVIEALLRRAGAKPTIALRSCSNEMTVEMIRRGVGASMMPTTFAPSADDAQISIFRIGGMDTSNVLYCNRVAGSPASRVEKDFVEIARRWVAARPAFALQ